MLRASSRCAVAIIALRNSPKWNCCLRLEPQAKGKQLQQRLEKSHAPRDGRQPESARWRDSQAALQPGGGQRDCDVPIK